MSQRRMRVHLSSLRVMSEVHRCQGSWVVISGHSSKRALYQARRIVPTSAVSFSSDNLRRKTGGEQPSPPFFSRRVDRAASEPPKQRWGGSSNSRSGKRCRFGQGTRLNFEAKRCRESSGPPFRRRAGKARVSRCVKRESGPPPH